ncbi:MAG: hypothetical protein ACOYJ1_03065 [Peptococcales bacterium]|jgi:hypothetical protein
MSKEKELKQKSREKISQVDLKRNVHEFSEPLSTDLKKLNSNKFFFNLEGEKEG